MNFKSTNRRPRVATRTIIYARCERTRYGTGARIQDIYQTTYDKRQWAKNPRCPNCGGRMVLVRKGRMPL